jgi:uncharacterized membrane protein
VLLRAVSIRVLAPWIILASTITSKDTPSRSHLVYTERVSMLLCMFLYLSKGTINIIIDSLRWCNERHCGGGSSGGGSSGGGSSGGGSSGGGSSGGGSSGGGSSGGRKLGIASN